MFKIIADIEYSIEKHKAKLAKECLDYNLIDAFRLIDIRGKGSVTQDDILTFLENNFQGQIQFNDDEVELFIIRFLKKDKEKICYSDFCTAFAP